MVVVRLYRGCSSCYSVVREAVRTSNPHLDVDVADVLLRGYTSVLEHCTYTFEVVCSRVCSHQLVRHRIASYTQRSMRWCEDPIIEVAGDLAKLAGVKCSNVWGCLAAASDELLEKMEGYIQTDDDDYCSAGIGIPCSKLVEKLTAILARAFVLPPSIKERDPLVWLTTHLQALRDYAYARLEGVPPEDARYLLPHSVKTRILVTMNARELFEVFLPLRLCKRAQWEIRAVAWRMLEELRRLEPELWKWAGPRCLRVAQLAGARCTLDDLLEGRCKLPLRTCPEGKPAEKIAECVRKARAEAIAANE